MSGSGVMNYKELQAYAEFKDVHLKVWGVVYFGTHVVAYCFIL